MCNTHFSANPLFPLKAFQLLIKEFINLPFPQMYQERYLTYPYLLFVYPLWEKIVSEHRYLGICLGFIVECYQKLNKMDCMFKAFFRLLFMEWKHLFTMERFIVLLMIQKVQFILSLVETLMFKFLSSLLPMLIQFSSLFLSFLILLLAF